MAEFITVQTLNGLVYSMLLFVFALGLSTTFGLLRFVNLAHGSFLLLGAYVGMPTLRATNSYALAALAGAGIAGGIGLVLERLVVSPLLSSDRPRSGHPQLRLALVFLDIAKMIWGKDMQSLPTPSWLSGACRISASVTFPSYRLGSDRRRAVALFAAVWLAIERTRTGALVRASVADRDMVSGIGFDVRAPLYSGVRVRRAAGGAGRRACRLRSPASIRASILRYSSPR